MIKKARVEPHEWHFFFVCWSLKIMNGGGGCDGRLGNKARLVLYLFKLSSVQTQKETEEIMEKDKRNFNLVQFMRLDNVGEIRKTT